MIFYIALYTAPAISVVLYGDPSCQRVPRLELPLGHFATHDNDVDGRQLTGHHQTLLSCRVGCLERNGYFPGYALSKPKIWGLKSLVNKHFNVL